ncbi:DUF1499 domain-containing protein [Yoonia sp. R2331]|uniref:DUF1499 domain-containing protein n=1 Tax=Yoonia sp. R2331 TaxID=3237238 RepID=UPI0034E5CFA8
MFPKIFALLGVFLICAAFWVRFAPIDPANWVDIPPVDGVQSITGPRSYLAAREVQTTQEGVLRALESAAIAAPRTQLIAGGVDQNMLVFQTRSLIWGFPDFTTVAFQDGLLVIYGRSKFGAADLAVNRNRIIGWLSQLGPLVVTPS